MPINASVRVFSHIFENVRTSYHFISINYKFYVIIEIIHCKSFIQCDIFIKKLTQVPPGCQECLGKF